MARDEMVEANVLHQDIKARRANNILVPLNNTFDLIVIPAQAGIHERHQSLVARWIPACAGMTQFTGVCFDDDFADGFPPARE